MLNILTNGYVLPSITNPISTRVSLIQWGFKAHHKSSSGLLYLVASVKNTIERVEIVKISRVLQSPVYSPQASLGVEASDIPKQAQHLSSCRKVQMETPESIRASFIPGEWVSPTDLSVATLSQSHPFPLKPKEVPDTVLRVNNKSG